MGRTIDNLRQEIGKLRHMSTDGRYFVCQHDINALFTRTVIAEAIRECVQEYAVPSHQENIVAKRIFTHGKIIFGILIWKKWLHVLIRFIEHDALDSQLPLEITRAEKIMENVGWDFAQNVQWEFLPQTLTKEMSGYHSNFRDDEILPFIGETRLGEGSFSEVFRVSVLPSLQTIFPEQTAEVIVVRKQFKNDRYLKRNIEHHQILDHLQHPNIVKLLASYSYCGKHHLLFPLFQMDLGYFLQLPERFGEFKNDYMFYTALQGLASALEAIHDINLNTKDHGIEFTGTGVHHDIEPSNILVSSRTFCLTGFTLARIHQRDDPIQDQWKGGLWDYVAPECMDENLRYQDVGLPLDVWSFGCMVSEVAAYIEGGRNSLNSFRQQRLGAAFRANMMDCYFFTGKNLRPQVISWFENFKAKSENQALHCLLDVARLMLKIDPIERPKAAEIHQRLSFLSVKALFDAVQQALGVYSSTAPEQIGPQVNARFTAWGKVLQFSGSRPPDDVIDAITNQGEYFCGILTTLHEKVVGEIKVYEAAPPSEVAFSIRQPFYEEIQELIEKLWKPHTNRPQVNYCDCKLPYKPELRGEIGSGGFAVVFLGEVQRFGTLRPELCAVKKISKGNHTFPRRMYEREIANFARLLEFEWFLQFFGWYEDEQWIYIAMEYIEFGDLQRYIDVQWTEGDTRVVARQLLEGLKVMHDDGILHRDLKPAVSI
ncbi:kinase-like domain-containing protein [Trichophaea hybrida]|nr:kinase-like domain-containing protein [Trichophaea hybrida]